MTAAGRIKAKVAAAERSKKRHVVNGVSVWRNWRWWRWGSSLGGLTSERQGLGYRATTMRLSTGLAAMEALDGSMETLEACVDSAEADSPWVM